MRTSLLVALVSVVLPVIGLADPSVPSLMAGAQRAYAAGDYDTATELFNEVLQIDPHNTMAINFLRKIKMGEAGKETPAKDPLTDLVIPKIEFKDATFSAALDFLKHAATNQSVNVSFVPKLPAEQMDHTVTLSLSQIPFLEALKYLCDLNNATYKQERYAILILPAPVPGADSPAPSPQ